MKSLRFIIFAVFTVFATNSNAQNLVVNGGAESPLGAEWSMDIGTLWTRTPFGGWVPPPEGNYHFFAGAPAPCSGSGGLNDVTHILSQTIDLSAYSTDIDAGIKAFLFSGYVRTWDDFELDQSRIIVEYRNAANGVLSTYDSGPTASTCCGNGSAAGWLQLTDTRFAPVGTRNVRIRLLATRLHSCDNDGYFDDITFEPTCVAGTTTIDNNSICEYENATLSITGQSGTIVWEYSYNSGGSWNTFGANGTSQDVNPALNPVFANSPVLFRPVLTEATCTNTSSNTVSLTINQPAVGGSISAASTTLCEGDNADLTLVGETGSIQWQQSDNGGPFTNVGGGINTYSSTPLIAQSPLVFRNISTLGGCTDTSNTETITVLPDAVGGTTNLTNSVICEGENSDLNLSGETGVIQWQQSINGGPYTNFGSTGNTETIAPTFAQTPVTYRAVLTSGSCMDTSSTTTITINEAAQGGTLTAGSTTVCPTTGTTLNLTGELGTIQWQRSLAGGPWNNFSGTASSISISPSGTDSPAEYRAVVTHGTCMDTSNIVTITINQPISGTVSISTNQICDGNSSNLSLAGESGTIQWQENLNGGGFTNFGGGTNAETVNPNVSESIANYRVITTIGACNDTSNTVSLTIDTAANPGTTLIIPDTLCEGSSTTLTNSGNNGSIQWQHSYNNGTWTDFGTGLANETISPINTNSVARYRAIITKGLCLDTSNIDSLTIIYVNGGTTTIDNPAICEGGSTDVHVTGVVGNLQWQRSLAGGPFNDFGTGGTTETVSPAINESIAAYQVVASIGSCSHTSNITQLLVDSAANTGITDVLLDTLCEGSSTTVSNIGNNGTIQWQYSYNGGIWTDFGTGLTTETISPSFTDSEAQYRAVISKGLCSEISNIDSIVIVNPIGGTTALSNNSICEGESSTVSISGESGSIQWERSYNGGAFNPFGTGTNSEIVSPTLAESPAEYRISASIGACSAYSTSIVLTINPNAVGGTAVITPDSICNGTSESLSLTGSTGTIQWQQSLAGGPFSNFGTGSNPETISPTTADNTPRYRAITTIGACPDTSSIDSVFIIDVNAGTITASTTTLCEGSSLNLTASGQVGTIQWQQSIAGGAFTDFGSGGSPETVSPNYTDNPLQYRLTVSTGVCTDVSSPVDITVETIPGTPNSITGNTNSCNGDTESYSILAQSDATGYNWTTTTGTIISGNGTNTIDVSLVSPSTTIEVYPTNICGTGLSSSVLPVNVDDYPTPIILNSDTTICSYDSFNMVANETSGINNAQLSYSWLLNGTTTGGNTNTELISNGGSYSVEITNNGLCSTTSSGINVTEIDVVVDAGQDQYINPGDVVTLNGLSNGSYNYSWTPSTNLSSTTSLTPSANPVISTTYQITATSTEGCVDTSSVLVDVLQFIDPTNSFTPNNDGINDSWELPGLQAYPDHTVEIFNRWGNRVFFSSNFTSWDGTFNGQKLPIATYYYIINLGEIEAPLSGSVTIVY